MPLSLIYARSENHCIGKAGRVPWRLPEDFKHFKRTTLGKPIVMGRRTYEDHDKLALPGRLNIVVTRQPDYQAAEGVAVVGSLDQALDLARQDNDEAFIIGGASFYRETFPKADTVYETVVHTTICDGDTFLPGFDFTGWTTRQLQHHPADDKHPFAFTVYRHDRREPPAPPAG